MRDGGPPAPSTAPSGAAGGTERCPRCGSHNTKFCYYNNYNLTQPRHFCKACRRYWTLGGSLRNVPVGGSTRSGNAHRNKQHGTASGSVPTATPTTKRCHLPAHVQAPTAASPTSPPSSSPTLNSADSDALSTLPISIVTMTEPTAFDEWGTMHLEAGGLTSLLAGPAALPAGFMALWDPFLLQGPVGFEPDLRGFGGSFTGIADHVGMSTAGAGALPAWPFFEEDDGAGLFGRW